MSKDDAVRVMNNSNLNEKCGLLYIYIQKYIYIYIYIYIFVLYIKMSEKTYYQRNRDMILNRAKEYYNKNKKV